MIKKDNEVLLRKLVEISMGKRSTIPSYNTHRGNQIRNSASVNKIEPLRRSIDSEDRGESRYKTHRQNNNCSSSKSLNMHYKIQELRRIEHENVKIAKKIISIQPSLKAIELEHQYVQHKTLSEGLRKIKKKRIPNYEGK
jgi:hypothetical protein